MNNKIKIPYSEWAAFHTKRGNGEFKHQRYGQSFHNYFNLPINDVEINSLFYAEEDKAYAIIEKWIEITNDDEEI